MRDLLSSKIRLLRLHYPFFALSSFLMGGWMVAAPRAFWGLFGLEVGEVIIPTVYGAAIVGEGVIGIVPRGRWPEIVSRMQQEVREA